MLWSYHKKFHSVNDVLSRYFFNAQLVTVQPKKIKNDSIITLQQVRELDLGEDIEAIVAKNPSQ